MAPYQVTEVYTCTHCFCDLNNASTFMVDLFSNNDKTIFDIVNYVVLAGVIALFGVITNVMNILVFYKQGFNSTVNISFFALAISDMFGLLFILWFGLCANPLFVFSDIEIWPPEVLYLSAGMPHICFARITGWITVFITAERCLCIALPLKIKQIITPTRTTLILIVIYIAITIIFIPEYATSYHCWKFYEIKNKSLLGLCFTENHVKVDGLAYFLYSTLGSASFVAVIIFTLVLIIQLNMKSKWRMKATAGKDLSKTSSNREKRTITMVVMISTLLIICYTPGVIVSMVPTFVVEFTIFGIYVNTFYITWSFVFVMETINSSINIFFYYKMSVKYRDTFRLLLASWFKKGLNPVNFKKHK